MTTNITKYNGGGERYTSNYNITWKSKSNKCKVIAWMRVLQHYKNLKKHLILIKININIKCLISNNQIRRKIKYLDKDLLHNFLAFKSFK